MATLEGFDTTLKAVEGFGAAHDDVERKRAAANAAER